MKPPADTLPARPAQLPFVACFGIAGRSGRAHRFCRPRHPHYAEATAAQLYAPSAYIDSRAWGGQQNETDLAAVFRTLLLTLLLTLTWLLMVNRWSLNSLVFGFMLGVIIPFVTQPYWPNRPRLQPPAESHCGIHPGGALGHRAGQYHCRPHRAVQTQRRPPTELDHHPAGPENTRGDHRPRRHHHYDPGHPVGGCLGRGPLPCLVHCLDAPNPDAVRDEIKQRYERRLMEIFE